MARKLIIRRRKTPIKGNRVKRKKTNCAVKTHNMKSKRIKNSSWCISGNEW